MEIDTAGNLIHRPSLRCRCGFTSGCANCRPEFPYFTEPNISIYDDEITKEEKARIYKKTMKSSI